MYISENKLRRIIRLELISENFTPNYIPEKAYDEVLYIRPEMQDIETSHRKLKFLGSPDKGAYYFLNTSPLTFGERLVLPPNEFKTLLSALKKLYGRDLSSSHKAKLKKALEDKKLVKLTDEENFYDSTKAQGVTDADVADFAYDTVADTVAAAAPLFGPGGKVLGMSLNASQAVKKLAQGKIKDAIISAIGAIPIPGFQEAAGPGLKNLSLMHAAMEAGKKSIEHIPNIIALIDGIKTLLELTRKKKQILIDFIKKEIFPLAKKSVETLPPVVTIKAIASAIDSILDDLQDIVDVF
jgi:hypothetical protein